MNQNIYFPVSVLVTVIHRNTNANASTVPWGSSSIYRWLLQPKIGRQSPWESIMWHGGQVGQRIHRTAGSKSMGGRATCSGGTAGDGAPCLTAFPWETATWDGNMMGNAAAFATSTCTATTITATASSNQPLTPLTAILNSWLMRDLLLLQEEVCVSM